jgi:hypothetical protein
VLTIRVTPVLEDGNPGKTVTHASVDSHRFEQVDPGNDLDQDLVLVTEAGKEHRYPLISHGEGRSFKPGHLVELRPAAHTDPEPVGDEVPDDLNRTPDQVRTQFFRDQAAADRVSAEQA